MFSFLGRPRGVAALCSASAVAIIASVSPAGAQEQQRSYNIPAQPLSSALLEFSRQSDVRVMADPAVVNGRQAPALQGTFTVSQGLDRLLAGSGLTHSLSPSGAILVAQVSPTQLGAADAASSADEEIVVTGTRIRGVYPESSPLEIYSSEDIARTGASTTEQFVQRLPQNLGTRTQFATLSVSDGSVGNPEAVNSIDLRGLGVSTTLTLLNGRRLALASVGQAVDVSLIPVGAIDRVEVLTDGASAIYGADAVGGVVNFVLRDDFEGAETRLSYGGVTSGGLRQGNFSQTIGDSWSTGHGLISFDAFSASALRTTERDFSSAAGDRNLTPVDRRYSALATISQDIGERTTLSGDFAFSRRDTKSDGVTPPSAPFVQTFLADNQTEQYFANLGLDYEINERFNASALLSHSSITVDSDVTQAFPDFDLVIDNSFASEYSVTEATFMLDGRLLRLPGGDVRFSTGIGAMVEEFSADRGAIGSSSQDLGRTTSYAFGELLLPIIGEDQGIPLIRRLQVSLAARYTQFEDDSDPPLANEFPSDTSPKIGVLWSPLEGLNLRGTYGESFRAPSLTQLDQTRSLNLLQEGFYPIGTVLFAVGPSPSLRPETAESYTLGFDFRPVQRRSFEFGATYFNISYVDRIQDGTDAANLAPFDPVNFPDYVFQPTSAGQIEEFLRTTVNIFNNTSVSLGDPAAAAAALFALPDFFLVDGRIRNLALSEVDGFDVSARDRFEVPGGSVDVGVQVTRILSYREQSSSSAPTISVVDTVTRPVDLRARAYVGFSNDRGFDTTLNVNYVDDYANPLGASGPQEVESWTTFDWNARYQFGEGNALLDGLSLRLSVQNVFDEDPPFVESTAGTTGLVNAVGFDPANANPLGRLVIFEVVKQW